MQGRPRAASSPCRTQIASLAFDVSWAGEDDSGGSGIAAYEVYVSDNGGPYVKWPIDPQATEMTFYGQADHTYAFYTIAIDNVGHREAAPAAPDAQTTIEFLTDPRVAQIQVRSEWLQDRALIDIAFTEEMVIAPLIADGAILQAVGLLDDTGTLVTLQVDQFAYDEVTRTLRLTVPNLAEGDYELRLAGAVLLDTAGSPLRGGDATAPGEPGGLYQYAFHFSLNSPPGADAGGSYSILEGGDTLLLDASASNDPDAGQQLTYAWTINGITRDASINATLSLTWQELVALGIGDGPAEITVSLLIDDGQGGTDTVETTLTVLNAAPIAALSNDGPVTEGSTAVVSFSNQFDPSTADSAAGFRYSYDFDSDGAFEIGDGTYAGSSVAASAVVPAAYLADGPGTRQVTARIIDKDGGYTDFTTTITIQNVAPVIALSGSGSINERAEYTLTLGEVTDPGSDTVTEYVVHWGDGSTDTYAASGSVTHVYMQGGVTARILVNLRDEDGLHAGAGTLDVEVRYLPPTDITVAPSMIAENTDTSGQNVEVGQLAAVSQSISASYAFSLVAGSGDDDNGRFLIVDDRLLVRQGTTLDYESQSRYAVRIRVTDGFNQLDKQLAVSLTDVNEPPEVAQPIPAQSATENLAFSFQFAADTFFDPDAGDVLFYSATLDGGSPLPAWLSFDAATRTFSGRPGFADEGPLVILVRAADGGTPPLEIETTFGLTVLENAVPWQNPSNRRDVDGSAQPGEPFPNDVLTVINVINALGSIPLPKPPSPLGPPPYVDVNGDAWVTPADVLDLINYINARTAPSGEAEAADLPSFVTRDDVLWTARASAFGLSLARITRAAELTTSPGERAVAVIWPAEVGLAESQDCRVASRVKRVADLDWAALAHGDLESVLESLADEIGAAWSQPPE
jgi:hypothetical protein